MRAYQQLVSFLNIDNADWTWYGLLFTGLRTQQSLGDNECPATIAEVYNVLSKKKFNKAN